jgi:hypothetical protein
MRLMLSLGTDGGIGISLALVAVISCKVPGRVTGVEWAFTLRNIKVSEDEREPIEIEHHQTNVRNRARLPQSRSQYTLSRGARVLRGGFGIHLVHRLLVCVQSLGVGIQAWHI